MVWRYMENLIGQRRNIYIRLPTYKYLLPKQTGRRPGSLERINLLGTWTSQGALRRGIIHRHCSRCATHFFLKSIRLTFHIRYCRHSFSTITQREADPVIVGKNDRGRDSENRQETAFLADFVSKRACQGFRPVGREVMFAAPGGSSGWFCA